MPASLDRCFRPLVAALPLIVLQAAAAPPAHADDIADFYRDKTISLVVVTAPGGVYDQYGRLLARHMRRHIPGNPGMVVQNMAGAAGLLGANYVFNIAPQDGTVLVNLHNFLPVMKALGQVTAKIEPAEFNWIGNMAKDTGTVVVSARAAVRTVDDAKRTEVTMGAPAPLALGAIYPKVMNRVLGTKFRLVTGYKGTAEVELALDRGEVDGQAGGTWFKGQGVQVDWYHAGKIHVLTQIGRKAADLPDVPLLTDLAANADDREMLGLFSSPFIIAKPTAVGPKVPQERVTALRTAYSATLADPAFQADAAKLGIDIDVDPNGAEDLTRLVKHIMGLPEPLLERARAALQ